MYPNAQALEEFVNELVRVAASLDDDIDVPRDFIKKHPWTLKYLSHFAESKDFRAIVKTPGVQIEIDPCPDNVRRFREIHGMKQVLRYRIFVPADTDIRTKEQIFKFEVQDNGSYVALSG